MGQEVLDSGENQEEDFAAMLEASFSEQEKSSRIVEGVVVAIQEDKALVDVGEKLEGFLALSEVTDSEGILKCKVNDTIKVMVIGHHNERPKISHKKMIEQEKTTDFIKAHKDDFEDIVVDVEIVKKNRGGYIAKAEGVSFFMPKSLAALKDDDNSIGKKIKASIVKIEDDSSVVISRRKYLNEERKRKKIIIDSLFEDDKIIDGVVKKITSYGMFVDVGGIDGLVHYNEISYKGPVNPAKLYKEGDSVEVKAIKYDKEKRHLSLSIKAVHSDPWKEVEDELDEGDTIAVTVSNIEPYGAFVDLGNDIEGFLHISEIAWDKQIKHPKEYLEVGEEIDVEVIEIDPEKHKLRVSLKTLQPKPFDNFMNKFNEGDKVTGVVTTLTDFGAFVKIDKVEGLLHNQDASWEKSKKCKDFLSIGDEVEVKIIKINKDEEKISLNRKSFLESPLEVYATEHKVGDIVEGTIRDIKDFGSFVSLTDSVDALIRTEDYGPLKAEELSKGQKIEAVISLIDAQKDRIRLSVRRLERMKEQKIISEFNGSEDRGNSLGDLIKEQL